MPPKNISTIKICFHYGELGGTFPLKSFGPLFPDWMIVPSKDY